MKYLIFSSLFFAFTLSISAQTKTVTNASLEKYRQARVKAEKEYRENYERLGMPSPEEINRREAERRRETAELSARLRAEQAERAQFDLIRQQNEAINRQNYYQNRQVVQPVYQNGFGFGFSNYGFSNYYNGYYPNRGFYNYNNIQRPPRQNYPRYDNPARFWSFTEIRPVPQRPIQFPVIIQPPPR